MGKIRLTLLIVLLILNTMVFTGQVWPEGAPPFGKVVNIIFLAGNGLFLLWNIVRKN